MQRNTPAYSSALYLYSKNNNPTSAVRVREMHSIGTLYSIVESVNEEECRV
jgi:hypothetical protein